MTGKRMFFVCAFCALAGLAGLASSTHAAVLELQNPEVQSPQKPTPDPSQAPAVQPAPAPSLASPAQPPAAQSPSQTPQIVIVPVQPSGQPSGLPPSSVDPQKADQKPPEAPDQMPGQTPDQTQGQTQGQTVIVPVSPNYLPQITADPELPDEIEQPEIPSVIVPMQASPTPKTEEPTLDPLNPGSFLLSTPEQKETEKPAPKEAVTKPEKKPEPPKAEKKPEPKKPEPKKPEPKKPEKVEPPKPEKKPEPPQKEVARAPKKGDPLNIPEKAKKTGNVDFLEGCWVGTRPEYNTKRIVTERFCFDKNGVGRRTILDPAKVGTCIGTTRATMQPGGVLRFNSQKMVCTNGGTWSDSILTCKGEGNQTPCSWVFSGKKDRTQSYKIRFVRE